MPRKRTTRAVNTRAKPKLKDSDETVNGMTAAERKARLDSLIKDLDLNVENVLRQYEEELVTLEKMIDQQFYQIRCKLSPMELQMTVEEYIEFTQSQGEEQVDTEVMKPAVLPVTSALINSKNALSKYSSLRKHVIDTIPEEGDGTGLTTVQKKQKKKRGATNQANGVTFNAEPLSTVHDNYVTPATQRNLAVTGWGATPLVTPKFDPRLPITPANARRLKPGEIGVSLAGSPLAMETDRNKTLVMNNGEKIEIEIPDCTDIKTLMSTLRGIMQKNEQT